MNAAIKQLTNEFVAQFEALVAEGVNDILSAALATTFKAPDRMPAFPRSKEEIAVFNGDLPAKKPRRHKGTSRKTVKAWRETRRLRKANG